MRLSLYFLFCLTSSSLVDVQAGGLKILGGYVEEYSENSREFYGTSFQWGQSEATKGNEARFLEKMYCWTRSRQEIGYCYHRLVVSTSVDPNKEHYQIVGSYQQIFDGDTLLETKYENGVTEEKPPYQKIQVAKGRTWCKATNSYKFGDLFFFVKMTTEPSITNDISLILIKADDQNVCQEEQFWKGYDSSSVRVQVAMVQTWSRAWKGNTFRNVYFWRALNQCMPSFDIFMTASLSHYMDEEIIYPDVITTVDMEWPYESPTTVKDYICSGRGIEEQKLSMGLFCKRAGAV